MATFSDPAAERSAKNDVDELALLVQRRGEEMSPSMKALIATTRVWLIVLSWVGLAAAFGLGVLACLKVYRLFEGAAFILPLIQTPASLGAILGLRWLRRRVAHALATRLERQLGGISGATSVAFPRSAPRALPRGP